MVAVEFDELSHAFDFVGSAPPGAHNAYIFLDTGQIHWTSESGSLDEEIPDDLETSDGYLVVPHKTDLDLGRSLALRFTGSELPDCQDQVQAFFRRKGAYARFKELLESKGALERWYKYEAEAIEKALRDWCVENGIRIIERAAEGGVRHQETCVGDPLETLKAELERYGEANDAATNERPHRMLNITRATGEFLSVLVRAALARRVLEIGTSNGYSTLWLAEAAKAIGGSVTTVEFADYKVGLASTNFARSGLSPFITLVHDDAGRLLRQSDAGAYDLIFLDSERPEYPGWWPHLRRVLRPGGLLIVDNATSHAEQMASLVALVKADPAFTTCLVPVGNGEFLAVKAPS